jgi:hypothetical protein
MRDRKIPKDSLLKTLHPARSREEGCGVYSTTKHGTAKNICTLPATHGGVHVHHVYWGSSERSIADNPPKRYWVRDIDETRTA